MPLLHATKEIDLGINGRKLELLAGETIYPGMLLIRWPELPPLDNWVAKHWFEGGAASVLIALQRKGGSIVDPYFENDRIPVAFCQSGDQFLAPIDYDPAVEYGNFLISAGNGLLRAIPSLEMPYSMAIIGVVCGEPIDVAVPSSLESVCENRSVFHEYYVPVKVR